MIVAAGLVAGNLVLFAPWRKGQDDRERDRDRSQAPRCCGQGQKTSSLCLLCWRPQGLLFVGPGLLARRLSGKKSARGAALSTVERLLRESDHGARALEMKVIDIRSLAAD